MVPKASAVPLGPKTRRVVLDEAPRTKEATPHMAVPQKAKAARQSVIIEAALDGFGGGWNRPKAIGAARGESGGERAGGDGGGDCAPDDGEDTGRDGEECNDR